MKKNINSLLTNATNGADTLRNAVDAAAQMAADFMEAMHGGEWRFAVDHKEGFVLIVPRTERQIHAPKRGEVV